LDFGSVKREEKKGPVNGVILTISYKTGLVSQYLETHMRDSFSRLKYED